MEHGLIPYLIGMCVGCTELRLPVCLLGVSLWVLEGNVLDQGTSTALLRTGKLEEILDSRLRLLLGGEGGCRAEWGVPTNRYGLLWWGDANVLQLMMLTVANGCECAKTIERTLNG